MALESETAGLVLRELEDEFIRLRGQPHEPDPAGAARAQSLHGLAVHTTATIGFPNPRRLRNRVACRPDRGGCWSRGTTAGLDPIQTEDLAFRARLDSNREPFGPRVGGERRAGRVHDPDSERCAGPGGCRKEKDQRRSLHSYKKMHETCARDQFRRVVGRFYTFASS